MQRPELIVRLQAYVDQPDKSTGVTWKGQRTFARFLIEYLPTLNLASREQYDFWTIEHHMPQLMIDAFEYLRTGTDALAVKYRQLFESDSGHEVPNITDVGESDLMYQSSAIQTILGFMLGDVMEAKWLESEFQTYCNAQFNVLQQTFDKFLRLVFCKGMGTLIEKSKRSGMSGQFGDTTLRTFITAGRIMFTFAKKIDPTKDSYYEDDGKTYCNEATITFTGEDGDPLLLASGIQSINADFRGSLDLIEAVIKNWPSDKKGQKQIFHDDDKVRIG